MGARYPRRVIGLVTRDDGKSCGEFGSGLICSATSMAIGWCIESGRSGISAMSGAGVSGVTLKTNWQFHAALPDTGSRRLGKLNARLAAGYIFHIFDRDRAKAQNKNVWHDYIRRPVRLFDCKTLAGLAGLVAHAVMCGDRHGVLAGMCVVLGGQAKNGGHVALGIERLAAIGARLRLGVKHLPAGR